MKKKWRVLILTAAVLFVQSRQEVQAETAASYNSNGVTSFFGTYEYPSTDPGTPGEPGHPGISVPGAPQTQGQSIIPLTGDDSMSYAPLLIQVSLLLGGIGYFGSSIITKERRTQA